MLSSERVLQDAVRDGSIDIAEWARVLEFMLQRLHDIVHHEFPIPSLPLAPPAPTIDPEVVASIPPTLPTSEIETTEHDLPETDQDAPTNSQSSTKENDAPKELAAGRPPTPPSQPDFQSFEIPHSQRTEEMPPPALGGAVEMQPGTLPPELLSSYQMSRKILEQDFAESPPYTIQRLAELVLYPKKHYRFLPAYLRALDRIVSVSSPVSDFPLPNLHATLTGGFLTNGEAQLNGISEREGLGSDEALGGALLTPIPWLRNQTNLLAPTTNSEGELHSESTETIEGPHGAGSIETVSVTVNGISSTSMASQPSSSPIASPTLSEQSDASTSSASSTEAQLREQGAVTQGELLRQEQEAGVVPVASSGQPMTPRRTLAAGGAAAVGREGPGAAPAIAPDVTMDDEQPHARGPDVIGMEDMGPQPATVPGGLDMEAAVGRGRSKSPQPPIVEEDKMEDDEAVDTSKPGQDPKDVEEEVQRLKEMMDEEKQNVGKDADGDVVVTDGDGEPVHIEGKPKGTGNEAGPDAVANVGR